jgi:sentrin-specific protease 1
MEDVIHNASNASQGRTLIEAFSISVGRRDIDTLKKLNWLNDEVINFYLQMICERSKVNDNWPNVYAFNTFFYPKLMSGGHNVLKRWTRKVDLFSYDIILIPVHLGMHWCLATVDFSKPAVNYYDSMGGNNTACLDALCEYLEKEHTDKKKQPYSTDKFAKVLCFIYCILLLLLIILFFVQVIVKNIPQQNNSSDCGMFACKFSEYLSRRANITFAQADMPYFRKRMIYEIVKKDLLHP